MKIGFIGAGKVGFSLGKYFADNGKCVMGYFSSNQKSAEEAAIFTNSKFYDNLDALIADCNIIFLTVPDTRISQVYEKISQMDIARKSLVHCSGALTSEVFVGVDKKNARGYSVHPLCAISDKYTGYAGLKDTYFTVEGGDVSDIDNSSIESLKQTDIIDFLRSLGNHIEVISGEDKVKYHAAAVCASNLVVGLYDMATELLKECEFSKEFSEHALEKLFIGNAYNITSKGVVNALTGPVERNDADTIGKHLAELDGDVKEIYRILSLRLVDIAKKKNPNRSYECSRKELI